MTDPGAALLELVELEWALWRAETRFDPEFMERVLAEDFREFGRSGRVYERADTLAVPAVDIRVNLRDMEVLPIAEDVALVTYLSEVKHDVVDRANRASVWVWRDDRWQLRFHQGTPTSTAALLDRD